MAPHSNSSLQARLTKPKGSFSTFHGPPSHSSSSHSTSFRRPSKAKFLGQRSDDLRPRGSSSHQKPLFGPGSKKSNIPDPSLAGELTAEMIANPSSQSLPLQSESQPQSSTQIPNGLSIQATHVDESSDDEDDAEAIADALLGRTSNPRILLGRLPSVHPPGLAHKEDGEVSDEDSARVPKAERPDLLSRRTSLLARMGSDQPSHVSGGLLTQADPTSKSIQQPSLLDRIPLPTAPRAHLHSNADRRVLAERNARAPDSHADHHNRYRELDTPIGDRSSTSRRGSTQGCEGPRRSSVSSLKRQSLYTVDESKDHPEAGSIDGYISSTMNKADGDADEQGSNASFHSHTRKSKENTSFGNTAHRRSSVSTIPNQTLPTAPSSLLTHRIDTKSDHRDSRLINDQHGAQSALLARIGDQSITPSAVSQSSIPAPVGLRDRLGLANSSASTVATTSKSLLERTIPKMQHPPPLQLVRPSPQATSSSEPHRSSRYADEKPSADRVLSPRTASSADWRHASYSSHPRRRHYSRSRSPVGRRSRYSPIPFSAHSRGRSPPSPRHRHSRSTRYSRSPPGFDRRRSPPRGPRGYRRPSSPAHSVSSRRRESHHSPPRAPYSAREYHHRRDFSSSQHSASTLPPNNSETRGRYESRDTHISDTHSLRNNPHNKPPEHISILISNLPSNLGLKSFDVYKHLTGSLYRDHADPSIPYELTLYRFAGTSRLCGELRFHREDDARTFEKKAIRRWKDEWDDDGQRSPSERRVDFVVVDRDRTPWAIKHCTYKYKHNALEAGTSTVGCGTTFLAAPDESSAMTTSANTSLKDETSSNTKEVGPPTPTSFKSNHICPPSPNNRPSPDEQRTCVLISSLRPSTNISVLHSLFIVPTRPRHFRIFQPCHISYGTILFEEHERKLACLLKFKDSDVAKTFFRILLDNAPFQPMEASLVQFESVHFCKLDFSSAIPIGSSSDLPQEEVASPDATRTTRRELASPPLGPIAQLPAKPNCPPPSPIGIKIDRILARAWPQPFQPNAHISPDFSHHHSSIDFNNHFIPSPFYNNFPAADHHFTSSGSRQPSVPISMLTPEEHRAYELRQTILARRPNQNTIVTHSDPDALYDNLRLNSPQLMNYPSQPDVFHEYDQDYLENGQHH